MICRGSQTNSNMKQTVSLIKLLLQLQVDLRLCCLHMLFLYEAYHGRIQRGGQGVWTPSPLKNHKNIGFLNKTCPDPLKNHKAPKPAFYVGPSLAHQ